MPSRVDANQREITLALRAVGCSVAPTHTVGHGFPDLVVGRGGQTYLLEVKAARGQLTPDEAAWHARWLGQVVVVRCVDDALRAVGLDVAQGSVR